MELKFVCHKCKEEKDRNSFGASNRVRKVWCKACCAEAVRKTYAKNLEYRIATKNKNIRNSISNQIYIYQYLLANPCVDCGESDPLVLQFDHVLPENKQQNVTALMSSNRERIDKEIALCVVLCANCHARKTSIERKSVRYQLSQRELTEELDNLALTPVWRVERTHKAPEERKPLPEVECSFCHEMFKATYQKMKRIREGKDVYCNCTCSNGAKFRGSKKQMVLEALKERPDSTYRQIGKDLGVTGEYVGMIARKIMREQEKLAA